MNRVNDKTFPNSIHDVVFQQNQFQPTRDGAYEKVNIAENTKIAVRKALKENYSKGALYFRTVKGSENSWHERALIFLFEHGGHRFYK